MKEDWVNKLRRKMEGYRMNPPEGLWEDICKQLKDQGYWSLDSEQSHRHVPIIQRRSYWVAAAGILALVGFFAFYHFNSGEPLAQTDKTPQSSLQTVTQEPVVSVSEPSSESLPSSEQEPQEEAPLLASVHKETAQPVVETASEPLGVVSEPSKEVSDSEQGSSEVQQASSESSSPTPAKSSSPTASQIEKSPQQSLQKLQTTNLNHQTKRWSLGVNASGGLLATNSTRTDTHIYNLQANMESAYSTAQDKPTENKDYFQYSTIKKDSKHYLPVRFGLSVQYQLNNRLALFSGINYTRLYSEFSTLSNPNKYYKRKLYYLGVPVGLAWQLWSTNHFHFYLSGGAMLEKCMRADLEGSNMGQKPWQWSVNAAAGAEYTYTPQVGIYLEPSLGYYFDDGTFLEHYYKEHPLAPSIEFGLRLHFNK